MSKFLVSLGAVLFFGACFTACAHDIDQARANYHREKAEDAAADGRYRKAMKEERKANIDQRHADQDVY